MRLSILFTLIFAVTTGITYAIVEESDAPFIYYYSPTERAIIIERADSADRTTIDLNKIIPADHNVVDSVHASPSGQWIAWISGKRARPSSPRINNQRGWLLRISDGQVISLGEKYVAGISWSPTQDKVAVLFTPQDNVRGDEPRRLKIVDPVSNETHVADAWLSYFVWTVNWHPDGDFVYFPIQFEDYDVADRIPTRSETPLLITFSTTGQFSSRPIIEELSNNFYPLPNGKLLYRQDDGVRVIETISTGDIFPLPDIERAITAVDVSPTQSHALIYVNTTQPDDIPRRELWLLDLSDYALHHLADNAIPPLNDVGYANPFYQLSFFKIPQMSWTPDGKLALFSTADGDSFWLNLETLTVEEAFTSLRSPQEIPDDFVLGSFFADAGTAYILRSGRIYGYDWQTDTLSADTPILRTVFGASSNGDYLAVMGNCNRLHQPESSDGKCLLNPSENRMHQLPPFPRLNTNPYYTNQPDATGIGLLIWHPTQDWIIIGENIEDRYFRWAYSVSDAEGYFYRELPLDVIPMWLHN